ncbi:histidine--tRNA ligase [Chitinophagaceae bacterium 26-R-25]|nr:histidine--tRNA ligase [Chitinophagaceae bacterium 26-R-25]
MSKPSLPQGTRDFSAEVVRKRNYIFNTIRNIFELYGFQPLETPAMENLETLMGKYGEEGDKLIFKILNNGLSDSKNIDKAKAAFENVLLGKNDKNLTERALRYDLTIPFARYVAMNYSLLPMPFKRYQIQPVWRADRPQRGRYREFYQCDADVVGSKSLLNEVELTNIYAGAFEKLNIPVEIRINSRKVLAALAEICGGADKMIDITIAIDKLDKIGIEKVKEELQQRGLNAEQINTIEQYLNIEGSNEEKIEALSKLIGDTETGKAGLNEINYLLSNSRLTSTTSQIVTDFTLARGLNYYTGIIFEIKAVGANMGSIGGGGRYDDLTGLFGVPNVPGVGISFGVDRIYDVMEELNLFPSDVHTGTQVLFFNLGEAESNAAFQLAQQLRSKGIRSELFHENSKFDKQFKYAEKKAIPYIVILGSKELEEKKVNIKNLSSGEQQTISFDELLNFGF